MKIKATDNSGSVEKVEKVRGRPGRFRGKQVSPYASKARFAVPGGREVVEMRMTKDGRILMRQLGTRLPYLELNPLGLWLTGNGRLNLLDRPAAKGE